jgi:hypothetical protein
LEEVIKRKKKNNGKTKMEEFNVSGRIIYANLDSNVSFKITKSFQQARNFGKTGKIGKRCYT